jgi:two-component system, OmpR family, sensor kinase
MNGRIGDRTGGHTGVQLDSDSASVRKASLIVAGQITVAAVAIVCLVVVLSLVYIIDQSQPRELLEKPAPGETKIYVDSNDVLVALVVVGIFAIVVAGVLSWIVARRAVRPLGDALRIQRTFVADASHELRTPLAVLDARIQVVQRRLPPGHELEDDIADIRRDTRALIDVVGDLLLAAAAEVPETPPGEVDVATVLTETIESMRILAIERQVRIELRTTPGIIAAMPETSLRRCIVAVLDNAITHSPDGSVVTAEIVTHKNTFEIVVSDTGPGVRGIEPERIFDRFAHAVAGPDADGNRIGFGIGLSLVRDLVVRHGGSVELRETSARGTTIAFTLPRV